MITSVWSSYGHRFMGTDTPERASCLTCGALFICSPISDDPEETRGEYHSVSRAEPTYCTGNTGAVHGYMGEKYCMECPALRDEPCEHERATDTCNCLYCDS